MKDKKKNTFEVETEPATEREVRGRVENHSKEGERS